MSRKGKGAALFELLYKDKGKATTEDGALKLPSWFRTKPQGTIPSTQPGAMPAGTAAPAALAAPAVPTGAAAPAPVPPPLSPPARPEPAAPKPSTLSADDGGAPPDLPLLPSTLPSAPASTKPAPSGTPGPAPSGAAPAPSAATSPPPRPAAASTPPTPFAPQRLVPPWASGPWLQTENGRFRLNITTFAAYVTGGLAVCMLLLVGFGVGRWSVRSRVAPVASPAPAPAATTIADARSRTPDPSIASPRPSAGPSASPAAGVPGQPDGRPVPGKFYVIVQTFTGNKDAATKTVAYFARQGYDVVVAVPVNAPNNFLVRTTTGVDDRASADKLSVDLDGVLAKMAAEVPGLVRYRANDPTCKPFVKQY